MHKLETLLEKYKRKLEDTADLKRQIKALEEQNTSLLERSHQVEDEYRKVLAFKTLMDSYKDQVQHLEQGNREILKERNKLEEEVRNMAQTCHVLEQDRDRNMEQVQLLEEQIREMELGGGTTLDEAIDRRASVVIDDDIDPDSQATEAPQSSKEQLQKEYAAVQEERDRLRQELNQIRNGIPDSLLNQTQTIMAFRSRILDLEKECTFLKEGTIKLEANVLQGTRSVAKDADTLQLYEKEHTKIQGRLNRLEDITKMQLHDINRMLVEANYLHGLGTDGVITDRPKLSDEDLEVIKEQNAALQIQVLHLQEEINETQSKTRKTREMIKLYTQLLQEMTARFMRPDEPSALLTRTPRSKEEENDLLKKQIHDVRVQSRREQQLIISAWYDLARRNHREVSSLSMGSTPSSWLGRQRKLLDGQLRKRLC
ncbi:hook-related protein family [Syncephalastrum racemosum]|uniref:Hook-related protein family n=1 Tax=Syncephalastrum racemosum TaxID=13706 RepID=A0A1X2H476_SYNRA|nr:hook-related protein family [Syncephalastrum racemosum]